jgi:hypothetical protein
MVMRVKCSGTAGDVRAMTTWSCSRRCGLPTPRQARYQQSQHSTIRSRATLSPDLRLVQRSRRRPVPPNAARLPAPVVSAV